MLRPSVFHEIVSGQRRGIAAAVLRGALGVAERFYSAAVRWRNHRYDVGRATVERVGVPVVSVGNLTLGGTGKTPLVRWLVRWFSDQGLSSAIVSRGYGAKPGELNDEALELRQLMPGVPHVQNANRLFAAKRAAAEFAAQVIVLDDGFQHRRLGRDLDVVLLDALQPFGFGRVFPRGLLREPLDGLRRADMVVLSRANLVAVENREHIWQTVRRYAPQAIMAEAIHAPRQLISASGAASALECVRGQPVAAFCALGNPAGFRQTLQSCGCRLVGFREFPDHHRFSPADLDALARWADELQVSTVLCTGKDLAKLSTDHLGDVPLRALSIELEFCSGQDVIESRLRMLTGRV